METIGVSSNSLNPGKFESIIFMRLFICLWMLCAASFLYGQIGNEFPEMEAESLTNQMVNIPADISGKYTLIGLAYSKKSEKDLKTWFNPTYNQFIHTAKQPSLFGVSYDVHVYFVPMFTGAKRAAYKSVMKKVKQTIDPKLQPHVMFYKGDIKTYKKALNFQGKDVPYFFVLDKAGKVVMATSGRYSDAKMQQVLDILDAADL